MSCCARMIFKGYLTCHNDNALKTLRDDTESIRIAEFCGHSFRWPPESVDPRQSGFRVSCGCVTMRST